MAEVAEKLQVAHLRKPQSPVAPTVRVSQTGQ